MLEPSKKLDKTQLVWDLLSQFAAPALQAMEVLRLVMVAKLLELQNKRQKPPS